MKHISLKTLLMFAIPLFFVGCANDGGSGNSADNSKKEYKDEVILQQLSDPTGLHPHCTSDAGATELKRYMFHRLLDYDHATLKLIPVLAKKLPTVEVVNNGKGMVIEYEMREGMTWDDGTPITAKDVEFSFKSVKNPKVDAPNIRPYVEFVSDFKIDPNNPLKFTMTCDKVYFLWDHTTGTDVIIAPKHLYDSKGLSDKFTFAQIHKGDNAVTESPENVAFAKHYNNIKFQREKGFINGSGPYKFVEWNTDQNVTLERKDNWWGDKFEGENMYFAKGPKRLVYETVNDLGTAITGLKGEKLDVLGGIRSKDWIEMPKSRKIKENFDLFNPPALVYSFLGMNIRKPKFKDKKTRQALAHLVDVEGINEKLLYNLATRVVGPISPSFKEDYNNSITPYPYSIETAKKMLAEAGWKDTNGDGIVDKVVNGKRLELKITYNYNQGNDNRKNVGLTFQEAARQAGVEVEVIPMEWSVFSERLKANDVEMWYGGWVFDPRPSDPKQIWHTSSYGGGSNYTGFGNAKTDKLIEDIQQELDPGKRALLYKEWQEILHDEVAYIFMFTGKQKIAIHNRFDKEKVGLSERDPGYWAAAFRPAAGFSSTAQ